MEKPLYPSKYMRITQGYNINTHIDSYAIDEAGIDSNISTLHAPFTGIIKKIYPQDANEVWLESIAPVEYPDGTIDYMTILFAHSNDISNLFVGQKINRDQPFYAEGTKGMATGNHCHIECGKGKFTGTGWHKNNNGNYTINNSKKPEECLWIDNSISIINSNNLEFKRITENSQEETLSDNTDSKNNQSTSTESEIKLIFTCPKTDLYGIYLKENEELYLKENN